jgi:ABC-type uncharacterized transport system substrate-binding protein
MLTRKKGKTEVYIFYYDAQFDKATNAKMSTEYNEQKPLSLQREVFSKRGSTISLNLQYS